MHPELEQRIRRFEREREREREESEARCSWETIGGGENQRASNMAAAMGKKALAFFPGRRLFSPFFRFALSQSWAERMECEDDDRRGDALPVAERDK